MKKRWIFGSIALAVTFILFTSGCVMKKSSHAAGGKETDSRTNTESEGTSGNVVEETSENETQEAVKYKSLIEKYVGSADTPYKAQDYMVKKSVANQYSAEEWLDSDGRLRLPFTPDDIKKTDTTYYQNVEYKIIYIDELEGLSYYYIPDELVSKSSTGELADIFLSYGYHSGIIFALASRPDSRDFEQEFEYDLAHSNALEESLRRDDFAAEYLERYMAESENMPEYYKNMGEENFPLYVSGSNKTCTLNMIEVLLAQPEACAQLTNEQRLTLVRRVIEKEKLGEQGKLFYSDDEYGYRSFFFACIAGELYLSGELAYIPEVKGEIQRQDNPWIAAIEEMELTEEEHRILDKYFGSGE